MNTQITFKNYNLRTGLTAEETQEFLRDEAWKDGKFDPALASETSAAFAMPHMQLSELMDEHQDQIGPLRAFIDIKKALADPEGFKKALKKHSAVRLSESSQGRTLKPGSAVEELDTRAKSLMREKNIGYAQALSDEKRKDPGLANRYNQEQFQ